MTRGWERSRVASSRKLQQTNSCLNSSLYRKLPYPQVDEHEFDVWKSFWTCWLYSRRVQASRCQLDVDDPFRDRIKLWRRHVALLFYDIGCLMLDYCETKHEIRCLAVSRFTYTYTCHRISNLGVSLAAHLAWLVTCSAPW
jgi:hypothetical protein